ncbi:MAG: hypothetical protein Q4F69_11755, partial [Bacteroidia bacterium]|nr:hypothetical protein [Bacteroidia bacterium]
YSLFRNVAADRKSGAFGVLPLTKTVLKKVNLIVLLFVFALGFSQCRKPVLNNFNTDGQKKAISFSTGDAKGEFGTAGNKLNYTWKNDDIIFVYACPNDYAEGVVTDFSNGTFCGVLYLIGGKNTTSGEFYNSITIPNGTKTLRFVHYGSGVTKNDIDGTASVSFATQNGTLSEISTKVVAFCDMKYNPDKVKYEGGRLIVQFAIAYFSFSNFGTGDLTVCNTTGTTLSISTKGVLSYSGSNVSTLTNSAAASNCYVVFTPDNSATTHTFYANKKFCDISQKFSINGLYSDGSGNAVTVTATSGDVTSTNPNAGLLPGVFSVGANKKVRFSRGNLQWLASANRFRFAQEQYHYLGIAGYTYNESEVKSGNTTFDGRDKQTKYIDWFGYGSTGATVNSMTYPVFRTTLYSEGDGIYYANNHLTNDTWSDCNWGVYCPINNGGQKKGLWDVLTKAQWDFLVGSRTNASQKWGYATINSVKCLVLLPDNLVMPDDISFTPRSTTNSYTPEKWKKLEACGAVALPAAGSMVKKGTELVATMDGTGHYWTSTTYTGDGQDENKRYKEAYILKATFSTSTPAPAPATAKQNKQRQSSVRLIRFIN